MKATTTRTTTDPAQALRITRQLREASVAVELERRTRLLRRPLYVLRTLPATTTTED